MTVSAIVLLTLGAPANSQSPTQQQIVDALLNRPSEADEVTGSRSLFSNDSSRGVTVNGGEKSVPSIDLKIAFEFDSDKLENEALLTLITLGRALASNDLIGQRIEIVGHTDARGTVEYNSELSQRRAAAVVDYVVLNFDLNPNLITSKGAGEKQLLDSSDPESEINRRVEIRNITDLK